jgi:four helix bundle protein
MSIVQSYRDLKVWQAGIQLAKNAYVLTRCFPKEETFGLTAQIRRSAASIPANIAEGHGRDNTGDFVRFLCIAQGSLKELETHLILSGEIGIGDDKAIDALLNHADEIGRMLRALIRTLQSNQKK